MANRVLWNSYHEELYSRVGARALIQNPKSARWQSPGIRGCSKGGPGDQRAGTGLLSNAKPLENMDTLALELASKFADGTSRRFDMPARIVRETYRLGILHSGMEVLEIGSGALRNASWLQRRGVCVDVVEYPSVIAKYPTDYQRYAAKGGCVHETIPRQHFDAVVSTFVLGTITPEKARTTFCPVCEKLSDLAACS